MTILLFALFMYVAYYTIRYGLKVWGEGQKFAGLFIYFLAACILGLAFWHKYFA
ncbi:hypothetical protein NCCP2222_25350 [Sporosarcina sp. NCCP-2222]|uniref:hypothetical protein n=1 Tax=Sporosarcina sp. NCCP-2222 TaxID=2935073 RepID=UPI00207E1988|nr:hypothetical protein [Sporosarcina sp. NCCP-2222]GKV56588.1 hypothetical protein NCCP2222_25350 [Sporosarcina sp. NCCP-2222]